MKGWLYRSRYLSAKKSVLALQRYGRGYLARKRYAVALDNHKATEVQRFVRGYLARRQYKAKIKNIVIVQSCVRRFLARKQFKRLKAEYRTISHLQNRYMGLENKIIELQQKYDGINKENSSLKTQLVVIPELR